MISNNKNNNKFSFIYIILIIIAAILFTLSIQFKTTFKTTSIERLIYNIYNMKDLNGAISSLSNIVKKSIIIFISIFIIYIVPYILSLKLKNKKYIKLLKKEILVWPISIKIWTIIISSISTLSLMKTLNFSGFILNNITYSNVYENNYVEYNDKLLTFPKEKRNLITIYIESLENSVFSKNNGGSLKESYMPQLEKITKENINFSNTNYIGGFHQVNGSSWTAAGLVSLNSGIPIYIKTTNKNNLFLEGATSIGEILENNGYNNYFLMGSDASFGDRKKYFTEHGNYEILDYNWAKEQKLIPQDYYKWWGFEDSKLYTFAKTELLKISTENKPFNFSILTADTHFYDGYVDSLCPNKFESNYANSYYCTDIMLTSFIEWIKSQDFYKNTTIVILGDHITMRDDFFDIPKNYDRTTYNLFINSKIKSKNTKNRQFTHFDILPTILASIEVKIDNDKLALGTNLFSNKKTLTEELGVKNYIKEIEKKSKYYNENILKN